MVEKAGFLLEMSIVTNISMGNYAHHEEQYESLKDIILNFAALTTT